MEDVMRKSIDKLKFIRQKRVGDMLFFIGTILDWTATSQEKQTIIQTRMKGLSNQEASDITDNNARTYALESWLFLVAVILFTNVSYARLKEQEANRPTNVPLSNKDIIPSYVVVIGNIFKVIGFALTAIGNQLKANSA